MDSAQRENFFFASESCGVGNGSADVIQRQWRILFDDLFWRHTLGKIIQDDGDHDSSSADARLTVAHVRVDIDSLVPVPHDDSLLLRQASIPDESRPFSMPGTVRATGMD